MASHRSAAARRPRHHHLLRLAPVMLGLLVGAGAAEAAGYRFGTQSAAGEGTANAGAAEGGDASTIFANPAGLTRLGTGLHVTSVIDYVNPTVKFTDAGSSIALPGSGLQPRPTATPGSTIANAADKAWVPHLYAVYKPTKDLAYGLGVFVPSGAKLDYGNDWGGRYNIRSVELKSLAINPNVAFKLNDNWSIAAGVTMEHMQGDLKRAVPYASAYAAGLLRAAAQASAAGLNALADQLRQQALATFGSPAFDGEIHVEGKGWGIGGNVAVLYEHDDKTRFGVAWRSGIKHKLKGNADWTQPATLPANVLAVVLAAPFSDVTGARDHNDSGASLKVDTPDSVSFHGFKQLTPAFAIMADATWYKQSKLKQLRINFDNTTAPSITAEHWRDVWRFSFGTTYRIADSLLLRAGVAIDESPVSREHRGAALPDSNRTWYALGANYKLSEKTSIDLAFGYVKLADAAMSATDNGEGETPCNCSNATSRGNYQSKATTIGMQLNHRF